LRHVVGITLIAAMLMMASLAFSQASHEPKGDAAGHGTQAATHGEDAHPPGEAPMPNEIWWKWANFAVLAAGLGYLIRKNAGPYFRARGDEIQKGIREAARVRAEADARAAEIERRVANLSGEIESLRSHSREEMAAEGSRVQAETADQIKKVQARAEMEIAQAARNATLELKVYSAQLALELAEKQIRQRLDGRAQEELANAFVHDLRHEKALEAGSPQ
jgi:F-type H+-transporting ATPase subunit b